MSFDVNDYRGIERIEPSPAAVAMRELHRIKAPTKRAAFIAQTMIDLPTQTDVTEFARLVRIDAKVQDVALLPDTTWTLGNFRTGEQCSTVLLLNTLASAENVRIDWPSVTFHWGVAVHFEWAGESIVARSADYQMTETYMSS